MHTYLKFCLTIALLGITGIVPAEPREGDKTLLRKAFNQADSIFSEKLMIPDSIRSMVKSKGLGDLRDTAIALDRVFSQGQLVGYGLSASVRGKSSIITVLVCLDVKGGIMSLELPSVLDPISARLTSPAWRKQFHGKAAIGQIDAMSGATISSSAVVRTVKALLVIYHLIRTDE